MSQSQQWLVHPCTFQYLPQNPSTHAHMFYTVQEPGKFNLSLVIMPSCWLGCNAVVPISFTALKQTAAEKAGKGPARGKDKNAPRFLDGDEVRIFFMLFSQHSWTTCSACIGPKSTPLLTSNADHP